MVYFKHMKYAPLVGMTNTCMEPFFPMMLGEAVDHEYNNAPGRCHSTNRMGAYAHLAHIFVITLLKEKLLYCFVVFSVELFRNSFREVLFWFSSVL